MVKMPTNQEQTPPWTRVFIEVAMRGLRRVHHEYLLFSVEQNVSKQPDLSQLNDGPGVAYADELTVCGAIAQEFLYSRYVSGVWIEGTQATKIKPGKRYYRLWREQRYPNTQERADFCIDRFDPKTKVGSGRPAFIEAKRAYRWTTKLGDTQPEPPANLLSEIRLDVQKLRQAANSAKPEAAPRGYILTWNIADEAAGTAITPFGYLNLLKDEGVILWQHRMLPLVSDGATGLGKKFGDIQVTKWLWVALAEVTNLGPEDLGAK